MTGWGDRAVTRLGLASNDLAGQVAIVTGAARGIGREVAIALAYLGAVAIVADIDRSGRDVAAEIARMGGAAHFMAADVSDVDDVATLVRDAPRVGGAPVTVLVNNAVLCAAEPIETMMPDLWDQVMAVNLRGAFLMIRGFLPGMRTAGRGTIVNMVSTEAMPMLSAYIASKQGLVGLTGCLAAEVGEGGVHVVALAPGMVNTESLQRAAPRLAPALGMRPGEFLQLSLHPAYAGLMPADHAGAATAYLVARLASTYHGEQVDGYAILERAGVISRDQAPAQAAAPASVPGGKAASELVAKLGRILAETQAEFGPLPVFVRPMARRGFRDLAGWTIHEWIEAAELLAGALSTASAGEPGRVLGGPIAKTVAERLGKLAAYYRQVPDQTARFVRDQAALGRVRQLVQARIAVIDELADALRPAVR